MKVKLEIHFPTAEELVEDRDAVSLIKYILNCFMDNTQLEGKRLHGMMDRMYLYNWSITGIMMHRRVLTVEQVQFEDLNTLRGEVASLKGAYEMNKTLDDLDNEILILEGVKGYNDITDFCNYDFLLSEYGLELFMDVMKLEARKTRRIMSTEDLQNFQDSGKLELWLMASKNRTITYKKSQVQKDGDFFVLLNRNSSLRKTVHNDDEKGVVGWLSPKGKFLKCGWAEHSKTAYEVLDEEGFNPDGAYRFDDAEKEFEKRGYIKFWKMMDDWGAGSGDDIKVTKPQIKWYEKNILIIADRQIKMFELMLKER